MRFVVFPQKFPRRLGLVVVFFLCVWPTVAVDSFLERGDLWHVGLLFMFAQERLRRSPSALTLTDLDATFIGVFLTNLETKRGVSAKTRNLR